MGIPEKIIHHLGYNTLGLMLDQDRKHWLMRVDKNKSIQDKNKKKKKKSVIDNLGSPHLLSQLKYLDYCLHVLNQLTFQHLIL